MHNKDVQYLRERPKEGQPLNKNVSVESGRFVRLRESKGGVRILCGLKQGGGVSKKEKGEYLARQPRITAKATKGAKSLRNSPIDKLGRVATMV